MQRRSDASGRRYILRIFPGTPEQVLHTGCSYAYLCTVLTAQRFFDRKSSSTRNPILRNIEIPIFVNGHFSPLPARSAFANAAMRRTDIGGAHPQRMESATESATEQGLDERAGA